VLLDDLVACFELRFKQLLELAILFIVEGDEELGAEHGGHLLLDFLDQSIPLNCVILFLIWGWAVQGVEDLKLVSKLVEELLDLLHLLQLCLLVLILRLAAFADILINIAEVSKLIEHLVLKLLVNSALSRLGIDFVSLVLLVWVHLLALSQDRQDGVDHVGE